MRVQTRGDLADTAAADATAATLLETYNNLVHLKIEIVLTAKTGLGLNLPRHLIQVMMIRQLSAPHEKPPSWAKIVMGLALTI
jgi:hypothetical protein